MFNFYLSPVCAARQQFYRQPEVLLHRFRVEICQLHVRAEEKPAAKISICVFCTLVVCFAGCYSSLEDQKCVKNGTVHDMIFWRKKCSDISTICNEFHLTGINESYCFDETTSQAVPIRKVIRRVLASEEYY